jgi:hypothetical protein
MFQKRFNRALAFTFIGALVLASAVLADDISNNLDPSVDAVAEVMPLTVGGANGTTDLYVRTQNDDGKNGCNLTGSTTLVVSVASSDTSVATVSPSSITFTSCGFTETLTVTPGAAGSATISVSQTSNSTDGSFNLAPATFTASVTAPPSTNTAPSLSIGGVTGGVSYDKDAVPAATCDVTDLEDGNSSFAADLSVVTGTYASDGIGEQTASCSYTDAGGLTASGTVTYSIVDPSPPDIDYVLSPALPDGDNSWYKSDVTLTWSVTEDESPNSLSTIGCDDQSITADQAEATYSCSASSAGGPAGPVDVKIKRDGTKPTISGSASPAANISGWNNTNVDIDFTCSDNPSGIASCGPDGSLTAEGAGQSLLGTAVDNAGNSDSATVSGINIDKTAPTVSVTGFDDGANVTLGNEPTADCSRSDGLSGLAATGNTGPTITNDTRTVNGVGSVTYTCYARDNADNNSSDSNTFTVQYAIGGGNGIILQPINYDDSSVFSRGKAVPVKFRLAGDEFDGFDFSSWKLNPVSVSCQDFGDQGTVLEPVVENPSNGFRYDSSADQYIYNANFKSMAVGSCWRVKVHLDSGQDLFSSIFRLQK